MRFPSFLLVAVIAIVGRVVHSLTLSFHRPISPELTSFSNPFVKRALFSKLRTALPSNGAPVKTPVKTPVVSIEFAKKLIGTQAFDDHSVSGQSKTKTPEYMTAKGVEAALNKQVEAGQLTPAGLQTKLIRLNQYGMKYKGDTVEHLRLSSHIWQPPSRRFPILDGNHFYSSARTLKHVAAEVPK